MGVDDVMKVLMFVILCVDVRLSVGGVLVLMCVVGVCGMFVLGVDIVTRGAYCGAARGDDERRSSGVLRLSCGLLCE